MRDHPFDEGGAPLSERDEEILRRLDADLGDVDHEVFAPGVATRPWRVCALVIAVLGLLTATGLVLAGAVVPGALGRLVFFSGLVLFAVSVDRALTYRSGPRRAPGRMRALGDTGPTS